MLNENPYEGDSAQSDAGATWLSHPEKGFLNQTSYLACIYSLGHFDNEFVRGMGPLSTYLVGSGSH